MLFRRAKRSHDPAPTAVGPESDPDAWAAALAVEGRLVEAVDVLAAANRADPRPARELQLQDLRARAAAALDPGDGREPWPPTYADPFPELDGVLPEVGAGELTTELLGGAVTHHGGLIVRGAFAADQVARLAEAIETTHENQADGGDGAKVPVGDTAWYHPMEVEHRDQALRAIVAGQGGTWLADSPTSTEIVLAELERAGVTQAITSHLGERPVFSLQKSTLRRSLPTLKFVAWHQDGSFLDQDVRTMNVWVALSPCGGDRPSPGLEILPTRLPGVLPVDGKMTPHSVSFELVDELAQLTPTVIPAFDPGDAILFDQILLHRTHLAPGMTDIRYALECWFFAPSHPATAYTPLLV